jgi:SAM-dependent methyltransferase
MFLKCNNCGLIFKNFVPALDELEKIYKKIQGGVWSKGYSYKSELMLIKKFCKQDVIDVLDIGAAGGWSLKSFAELKGRLSALDVSEEDNLKGALRGEYIEGALDSVKLKWSQNPYDVVTVFDVIEHLYDPNIAFNNLAKFVKKSGIVVIETGDINSSWPQRFGIANWWYTKLLPHHIFWTKNSLIKIAKKHGFTPIHVIKKRNKNVDNLPFIDLVKSTIRAMLFCLSPNIYRGISKIRGTQYIQPRYFNAKDHIQIVFRKDHNINVV